MAGNKIICNTNNVDYITLRKAMIKGARTKAELKEMTGACLECAGCKENIDYILASVCGCKNVMLADVVDAVKNGADTVEKVGNVTGAGTDCGRCQALIANVIEIGR